MHRLVIDCGFGDAGKGLVVDYLCSHNSIFETCKSKKDVEGVVRFSGGHQVSHTVVTDETRHVFSNFGAGTLRGIPTYWSKFCTVEPMGLFAELQLLRSKGTLVKLFIDGRCPITTPYDVHKNEMNEWSNKHGSCGVGFGATIKREEDYYSLTFFDLFYPQVFRAKLSNIADYYKDLKVSESYLKAFIDIRKTITEDCPEIKLGTLPQGALNLVFEGSQGLLLDQHFGFFPNVTRSDIGSKNVISLLSESVGCPYDLKFFDLYLVTRAYQTRHGTGFMTNEDLPNSIIKDENESNGESLYQGKFRRSLLDVSLLEYAINKDEAIRNIKNRNLIITCLDHMKHAYSFTYKERVRIFEDECDFVTEIAEILKIDSVYLSRSSNSKNIERAKYVKKRSS